MEEYERELSKPREPRKDRYPNIDEIIERLNSATMPGESETKESAL